MDWSGNETGSGEGDYRWRNYGCCGWEGVKMHGPSQKSQKSKEALKYKDLWPVSVVLKSPSESLFMVLITHRISWVLGEGGQVDRWTTFFGWLPGRTLLAKEAHRCCDKWSESCRTFFPSGCHFIILPWQNSVAICIYFTSGHAPAAKLLSLTDLSRISNHTTRIGRCGFFSLISDHKEHFGGKVDRWTSGQRFSGFDRLRNWRSRAEQLLLIDNGYNRLAFCGVWRWMEGFDVAVEIKQKRHLIGMNPWSAITL